MTLQRWWRMAILACATFWVGLGFLVVALFT